MRMHLSKSEYAELRLLQRNVTGASDYVKVTLKPFLFDYHKA